MSDMTVSVTGNLVSDVAFQVTSSGVAYARFRVASTARRLDRSSGHWVDGETTYWNVTAWRRAAENARESLAKGHPVVVTGRLRQRTVDREVESAPGATMPVTYVDIEASAFGLDLTRCRSRFVRAPLGPQTSELATGAPAAQAGGQAAERGASESAARHEAA